MTAAYPDPAGATLRTMPDTGTATTADGVRISWTSVGDGPTLIHLPGVPFSNTEGEWRIPALRRTFDRSSATHVRFIQYDGRGTGRSQRDVSDLSLEALPARPRRGRRGGRESSGSCCSASTTRRPTRSPGRHAIPERVRGLVLFGGTLRGWDAMRGPGTQALLSLIERDWDTFVESVAHAWLGWPAGEEGRLAADWFRTATTPTIARATFQAAVRDRRDRRRGARHRARSSSSTAPTRRSSRSSCPRTWPERCRTSRLEVLPGSSASLFFEDTDGVVDRLVAFVARPGGRRPAGDAGSARRRRADGRGGSRLRCPRARPRSCDWSPPARRNGQIAARLAISINTVERHVTNVYRKIDARGRAEATAWAIRNGVA